MTLPELSALRAVAADRKAAGLPSSIAETVAEARRLVTLGECLRAEAGGETHVEFRAGAPVVVPGPARFVR